MENEESGPDNGPDGLVVPELKLEILTPQFGELMRTLRDDIEILFPDISPGERTALATAALISIRMDESVKLLKMPVKVMKMTPEGVILPGG